MFIPNKVNNIASDEQSTHKQPHKSSHTLNTSSSLCSDKLFLAPGRSVASLIMVLTCQPGITTSILMIRVEVANSVISCHEIVGSLHEIIKVTYCMGWTRAFVTEWDCCFIVPTESRISQCLYSITCMSLFSLQWQCMFIVLYNYLCVACGHWWNLGFR